MNKNELMFKKYNFSYVVTIATMSLVVFFMNLSFSNNSFPILLFVLFLIMFTVSLGNMKNISRFFHNQKNKYQYNKPLKKYSILKLFKAFIYLSPIVVVWVLLTISTSKVVLVLIIFELLYYIINIITIVIISINDYENTKTLDDNGNDSSSNDNYYGYDNNYFSGHRHHNDNDSYSSNDSESSDSGDSGGSD